MKRKISPYLRSVSLLLAVTLFTEICFPSIGISSGVIHRINNYTGYQRSLSLGASTSGMVGLSANFDPNGVTYSPYISPLKILTKVLKSKELLEIRKHSKHTVFR